MGYYMTIIVDGSSGLTFPDNSIQTTSAFAPGFRNQLVNGAMQFWQRGTSSTHSSGAYTAADRLYIEPRNSTSVTVAQSTDVPTGMGFAYSARIYATVGTDDGFHPRFSVELPATGNYGRFVAGTTWTLSYWAKSAYTGRTINPQLALADTHSVANVSNYAVMSTSNLTTSWQRYTHTLQLPTWTVGTGSLSLVKMLLIRMISGADNTPQDTYITGVQLEEGTVATPFEHRPIGIELAMCQRYAQYLGNTGALTTIPAFAQRVSSNLVDALWNPAVPLRAAYSITSSSPAWATGMPTGNQIGFYNNDGAGYSGITGAVTVSNFTSNPTCLSLRLTAGTSFGATAGHTGNIYLGDTCWILYSAEL
jgi:hypothetical protein